MPKIHRLLVLAFAVLLCSALSAQAQSDTTGFFNKLASRIFLPSVDAGYLMPNSDILEGSFTIRSSVEYRIRNNNDFFIRLSYDTYGSRYTLPFGNATTNTISGTAQFTDLSLAPGYRLGDRNLRVMFTFMPGLKFYEFPTATLDGQQITISQSSSSVFTTTFLTTFELYFDEKSAITLSLMQNQVWDEVDFWQDGGDAYGISLGFITSLLE